MTPAFTVTITADSVEQLQTNMRDMLPGGDPIHDVILIMPFQDLLLLVGQRVDDEGYEMEVWKKGERETSPAPSTVTERKKEEARAKLRGELSDSLDKAGRTLREDLVASLAEATHATAPVKDEIEAEVEAAPEAEELPKPKRGRPAKTTGNGKAETADQLKARTIIKLQELFSAGKKAEVNKILAQFGEGQKTFSSIPAEQFEAIAQAAEAI